MLEKMEMHQTNDQTMIWKIRNPKKTCVFFFTNNERRHDWSGTFPQGARNTIRSKIENKLTEKKIKR